jgi:outer membrane receptor protein involved in Fe transport
LRLKILCIAVALASAPVWALAADLFSFDIAAQPLPQALVTFATQADISIDAAAGRTCKPTTGLRGRFDVESGLRRLLAGTGCGYRLIDPRTVIIVKTEARAPPASRPALPALPPVTSENAELQEVVVTSPKRSVALSRAPYAVSAVRQADLVDGATTMDTQALATRVAGMTVTNLGPGRDKVFLRGMSDGPLTGRTQSVVGIYLDDTRIVYNAPDPDLRLTDIDRVEVLRGPQGSLYGAGSMGGVMQIITRSPDLDRLGGLLSASIGATADGAASGVIEGALNVPVVSGKLAARVAGYSERVGGFIDDPGQGLKNLGGVTRQGLRASALYRPSERLSVRLTYLDQGILSIDSQYSEGAIGSRSRAISLREPYRNDFDGVSAITDFDLGWARLKIAKAGQWNTNESLYEASLSHKELTSS